MKGKKFLAALGAIAMLGCSACGLAACDKGNEDEPTEKSLELVKPTDAEADMVTYNTYTAVMPSNWNELTYEDNNDTQIMGYLGSPFFEYDYKFDGDKFDADGKVNFDNIVDDDFVVKYSAATKLEDVTADVDAKWEYDEKQKAEGGYAWKITLRDDLKWDDGTAIDATDFVYTMQQQLDPKFQNYRASSYYGAVNVIGAKDYVYQGQKGWFAAGTFFDTYSEDLDKDLIFTLGNEEENKNYDGAMAALREAIGIPEKLKAAEVAAALAPGLGVEADALKALEGKSLADIKADAALKATWDKVIGKFKTDPNDELYFFVTNGEFPEFKYEDVGFYSPSKYELVVCFSQPSEFLKDDGTLSYLAAYTLQSFPLVHKVKYEASKIAPSEGSTLWTTNYNTSLETSASWGPYKLGTFQSGKSYTLVRNDNWYGYKLDDNKDQYLIDRIYCEKLTQVNTQWMSFFGGAIDAIGIDVTHAADFKASKYAYFTPDTYTYSWHLNADIEKLKVSGRNNGILAIHDFRKALSLSIDRDEYASELTTANQGYFGYLNETYYYDVVNNGIYRHTAPAKKAILRAYGYTEEDDGTWSLPGNDQISHKPLDDAYKTVTGYNPTLAKEYLNKAIAELEANAETYGYDATKNIEIKYGASVDNENVRRQFNKCQAIVDELAKDTKLEGKIKLVFDSSFGSEWANKFRAGEYELCTSAWGGASFNPCYLIGAYIEKESTYTPYWDLTKVNITFTLPEGDYEGAGTEITESVYECYNSLNGIDDPKYKWDVGGDLPEEARLTVLAAIEERILTEYYSIPTMTMYAAELLGAKFSYAYETFNTFMDYGGMRYMRVNYNDGEWYDYVVNKNNRDLQSEYKKTAE